MATEESPPVSATVPNPLAGDANGVAAVPTAEPAKVEATATVPAPQQTTDAAVDPPAGSVPDPTAPEVSVPDPTAPAPHPGQVAAVAATTTDAAAMAPKTEPNGDNKTTPVVKQMFRPPDHVTHDTDFMDFAIDLEDLFTDCYYPDVAPSNPSATAAPPAPVVPASVPTAAEKLAQPTGQTPQPAQQPAPAAAAAPAPATTTTPATTTAAVTAKVAEKGIVVPSPPAQEQQMADIVPSSQIPSTPQPQVATGAVAVVPAGGPAATLPMKRPAIEAPAMVTSGSRTASGGGAGEELTEQQKLERRERNREHAKRSRLRKKFLLESLQEQIHELQEQMDQLKNAIKEHVPTKAEEIIGRVCGNKEKYTPLPTPSGFGPVKTLMEPDFRLMSALSGSQQNFAISDPTIPDNPIVYVSQGFLSLTGYTLDQVLGRNCRFLQGPGTDQSAVEVIRKGIAEGVDTSVCLLNYKADGTPFWNQFFVAALRDAEDNVVNYVGVQCEVSKAIVEKHMGSDGNKKKKAG